MISCRNVTVSAIQETDIRRYQEDYIRVITKGIEAKGKQNYTLTRAGYGAEGGRATGQEHQRRYVDLGRAPHLTS